MSEEIPRWIPVSDPRAAYLAHRTELDRAIRRVLESGQYILGPAVEAFEEQFAAYLGVRFCVGLASGTDAIQLALRAVGVKPGDAVLTASHTAVASVAAIDWLQAIPVLVDIDPLTYTLDPQKVADTLRADVHHKIKAILPVHLYGHPADMEALFEIVGQYDVPLIEDCAQAHGASLGNKKVGSLGLCGTFSFYPTKNLGAFGDGGAVTTNDPALAERLRLLRQYGWRQRYISEDAGYNSRLDELQAAILACKLPWLDAQNARRRHLAGLYQAGLFDLPIKLPCEKAGCFHVYHQYVIEAAIRDGVRKHLERKGIQTTVLYPVPVHLQPGYRNKILIGKGGLVMTEAISQRILSLPIYPELNEQTVQTVIQAVLSFWDK